MNFSGIAVRAVVAAVVGVTMTGGAIAQTYPTKSVRIVVPYPPGGGNDLLGRPIAQKLSEKWGHNVVIDNRPGASGMIGAEAVVKSAADGYTILLCASPECALNATLYPKMAYNPVRDLAPITQLAVSSLVLIVHPSLPARTAQEYIALAKKQPRGAGVFVGGRGQPAPHCRRMDEADDRYQYQPCALQRRQPATD